MNMVQVKPTTPKKVSRKIKAFLRTLGITNQPIYLPFSNWSDKYKTHYCLSNCEAENVKNGYEIIYGWILWEDRKKSFIEGEFHSVLEVNGKLVDITPRLDGEEKILFAIDPKRIAERIDEKTWNTWSSHKSMNGTVYAVTEFAPRPDLKANILY